MPKKNWASSIYEAINQEAGKTQEKAWGLDPQKSPFSLLAANPKITAMAREFPELKTGLEQARKSHERLYQAAGKVAALAEQGNTGEANRIYQGEMQAALAEMVKPLNEVLAAERKIRDSGLQAQAIFDNKVQPNLEQVQSLLTKIRIEVKQNMVTEAGLLSQALANKRNVMFLGALNLVLGILASMVMIRGITKTLKGLTLDLEEASDQVATASALVSTTSQDLAQGTSQQAAALEETGASLAQISATVQQNSQHAEECDRLVILTNEKTKEVHRSIRATKQSMETVAQSGASIKKIIKNIDEIAFQTNLLALNAAVEEMDRVVQQNAASAEESSGASQELTTQSRQMKMMVEDLHLLVSGNSSYRLTEGNGGHMRIAAEEDHGSTPLKTLPAPSLAAGQSLKPGPPLADKSPEQIIPLEGDNF